MDLKNRFFQWRRQAQTVPAFLQWSLYAILTVAAVVSVPFIGVFGPIPIAELLDAWVIAFIMVAVARGKIPAKLVLLALGAYFLTRLIPALVNDSPVEEFLRAYRWLLYLVAFALGIGWRWGPLGPLIKVIWVLIGLATLKASLTLVLLGPGNRPGLLMESNFELALFAGLLLIVYARMPRARLGLLALLGVLSVLEGSRSGSVAFVIVAAYAILLARAPQRLLRYIRIIAIPALLAVPAAIFFMRGFPAIAQIDRFRFFNVFLSEAHNWSWVTWLVGTPPLTPLSAAGCDQLAYYQSLFSLSGDGACYSVILHAFLLRVVFDAGVIGLLISVLVPWYLLWRSKVGLLLATSLVLIAVSNGMSVSGVNNPYVAVPILLAVLLASSEQSVDSIRTVQSRPAPVEGAVSTNSISSADPDKLRAQEKE